MAGKPKVLLIVTADTKAEEAAYLRACLEEAGVDVVHMDPSVRADLGVAEIRPEEIANAAGKTIEEVRALKHEGKCQAVMMEGAIKLALDYHKKHGLSGILSIGGSMGTTLSTAVMRAFPYGFPKLMISTMASGFTALYVGNRDIAMLNSVVDINGLNSIAREVYRNGALALAGMAKGFSPSRESEKPLVLMTTLGTTEKCAKRIRSRLEDEGFEVMIFHSSGAGGPTLDSIAADRGAAAVIDLSLIEVSDFLKGGLAGGSPDRSKAALEAGIPTVFAPGNIDFIIAGPIDAAKAQFPNRRYHIHNSALTAVRAYPDDFREVADHMAGLIKSAKGPVSFFTPLGGLSSHDSPEGHLYEPGMASAFAERAREVMPESVNLREFDAHINDDVFADAIADEVLRLTGKAA